MTLSWWSLVPRYLVSPCVMLWAVPDSPTVASLAVRDNRTVPYSPTTATAESWDTSKD